MLVDLKSVIYGTIPYLVTKLFYPSSSKLDYYNFFRKRGYTHYPYEFAEKYIKMPVQILWDEGKRLPYVVHRDSKRLYFPRDYSERKVEKVYKALLIEQDTRHPHHYVDSLNEFEGRILLDVGAAEGFTSLDSIDVSRFVYLFECEDKWIEALQATFEPWKEKVMIVKKYISDRNDEMNDTLDHFLEGKYKESLFLKMDIEGAECDALKGSSQLFSDATNLSFAICTYHKKDDPENIAAFLERYGCSYFFRDGYFFVKHKLRKCLIRGKIRS